MKKEFVAFGTAFIFGVGLVISGMTLPSKVLGFLDFFGSWDPSLMAVMFGAIFVHALAYRLITKRKSPVLAVKFQIPTQRDIDWKLLLGASIFGLGWGLGGLCPGPALVGAVSFKIPILIFVGSMILGMYGYQSFNRIISKKESP